MESENWKPLRRLPEHPISATMFSKFETQTITAVSASPFERSKQSGEKQKILRHIEASEFSLEVPEKSSNHSSVISTNFHELFYPKRTLFSLESFRAFLV